LIITPRPRTVNGIDFRSEDVVRALAKRNPANGDIDRPRHSLWWILLLVAATCVSLWRC